jgi:hypothetical protein
VPVIPQEVAVIIEEALLIPEEVLINGEEVEVIGEEQPVLPEEVLLPLYLLLPQNGLNGSKSAIIQPFFSKKPCLG